MVSQLIGRSPCSIEEGASFLSQSLLSLPLSISFSLTHLAHPQSPILFPISPFAFNSMSCSGLSSRCVSPSRFRECCSSVVPRGVSGERLIRAGRRILWQNIVSRGTDEFHRSHNRIMCSHRILLPSYHHLATHRPHSIILLAILMNNSSIFMG